MMIMTERPEEISEEELREILHRAEAARKGPWKSIVEHRDDNAGGGDFIMIGPENHRGTDLELIGATVADQDFIAAARQDVPKLVAAVLALKKRIADLEG